MLRFIVAMTFAIAAFSGVPASAQFNDGSPFSTGNNFARQCPSKTWELACRTYALGVFHGNQLDNKTICLRPGVDGGQMYEIAMAYIKANPQKSDNAAFAMLLDSWVKEFPCPNAPRAAK
jgi:Rap1a immunity proteins